MWAYKLIYNILRKICEILTYIAAVLLIIMTLTVIAQVIFRYVLSTPFPWAEELAIYLMVYMAYLCLPFLVFFNKNVAMTLLYDKFKHSRIRFIFDIVFMLLIIFVVYMWLPQAINTFRRGLAVTAYQLPINRGMLYSIIPISLSVVLVVSLTKTIRCIICLINPTYEKIFMDIEISNQSSDTGREV